MCAKAVLPTWIDKTFQKFRSLTKTFKLTVYVVANSQILISRKFWVTENLFWQHCAQSSELPKVLIRKGAPQLVLRVALSRLNGFSQSEGGRRSFWRKILFYRAYMPVDHLLRILKAVLADLPISRKRCEISTNCSKN